MTRREAEEPGRPANAEVPEQADPEEAILLSAWAGSVDPAEDLPEEILGLLDGTLRGKDAERARVRLAGDPALARAAGDLIAEWRGIDPDADLPAVPGVLMNEALDRVPPSRSAAESPGLLARLAEWTRAAAAPGLAAAAAGALLVTFVVMERSPAPDHEPTVRAGAVSPSAIHLDTPAPDAQVTGSVDFHWEPLAAAVRYRLVLVDAAGGDVTDAGHTEGTTLRVPADFLAEHFGAGEAHAFHWIVRARLLDGAEVSSEPRRVTWSAR